MNELVEELRTILNDLEATTRFADDYAYFWTLNSLLENLARVENAWCRSWSGHLANVYCIEFGSPTLDMYTSLEMLSDIIPSRESSQDFGWRFYSNAQVDCVIEDGIERSDINNAFEHTLNWVDNFRDKKLDVLAIIKIAQEKHGSIFEPFSRQVEQLQTPSPEELVETMKKDELHTGQTVAEQRSIRIPPHIRYRAKVKWSKDASSTVRELRKVVERIIAQLERIHPTNVVPQVTGTKIFIGHGRDKSWLELQKFIENKLQLPTTAYEEVQAGGYQVFDHVMSRINEAIIAFLVMTGEDTVTDKGGKESLQPRLNVIHELGLCQSKLGQNRAIALVEKGCHVPTNITGFHRVYFEKGNILSASEDIRDVLAREEIT